MTRPTPTRTLVVLTLILLVAAAFRLIDLAGAPPGLQHDEVFHAHDAFTVRQGYTPLWFSSNAGNEPLYIYLMALTTATIGDNVYGIRFTAVLCGLLTLAFTYRWAVIAVGRREALLGVAFMAVTFWPVWMSRVGLRAVSLPPLVALTAWLYTRALLRSRSVLLPSPRPLKMVEPGEGAGVRGEALPFALAGVALALTLYTYPAAFAVPLTFAAYYVYLLLFRRPVLIHAWRGHLAFWLAASIAYLPLALALAGQEGGYLRVQQTALPLEALRAGDPVPLLDATGQTLLMWTTHGDPLWRYNLAGRPVFGPVLSVVFLIGFVITIWFAFAPPLRQRRGGRGVRFSRPDSADAVLPSPTGRERRGVRFSRPDSPDAVLPSPGGRGVGGEGSHEVALALIPLLILIGMAPSAVTDSPPAFLRASAALPAAFVALGIGANSVWTILARTPLRRLVLPLALILIAATAGFTTRDYFITWAANEEVERVYRTDLDVIAAYLRTHQPPGGAAISTTEPHHLDRFLFDYTPHGDADVHWFDGLYAITAPAGDAPAWVFVTREPTPGDRLQSAYYDHLPLLLEENLNSGALAFRLYEVPPGDSFFENFPPPTDQPAWVADALAFPPADPDDLRTAVVFPAPFGDVLQLVGYESAPQIAAGQWLPITLYFRALRDITEPEPWVLFAHLLDADGQLVAGRDFLAVPASTWRSGDAFVQLHDVLLDTSVPPGLYHLEIGLYSQADGSRFPLMVNGVSVGDRLLLEPVEVIAP